ncbi:MAG: phosphatidate cytidylyltransferase [Planctomycetota bacterium]
MTYDQTRIAWGAAMLAAFFGIISLDVVLDSDLGLGFLGILVGAMALLEFYNMAGKKGLTPFRLSGLAAGLILFLCIWWEVRSHGEFSINPVVPLLILLWFFLLQGFTIGIDGAINNVAVTLFGVIYVFFLLSFAMALRHLPGKKGLAALIGVLLMAKITDIGGYFFGRSFGRRKLCPAISPNKTVEGALFGLFLCVLIGVGQCLLPQWSFLPMQWAIPFALLIGVGSISGDLFESMMKRDAGVKDSGDLVPTFGGVLDIIDCILVCLPLGYYFLALAPIGGVK